MLALEKYRIGSMELKNRIAFAPMGYLLDGMGPIARKYFEARCKGGAGLIFNHYPVMPTPEADMDYKGEALEDIKKMADMIHSYGAKGCMQMFFGYGRVQRFLFGDAMPEDGKVYSASAVPELYHEDKLCVELTTEQIKEQLGRIRTGARFIAKESGYDCIEVHAYGGYMMDCFLTERWNKRTDEYGGKTIWERSRFLREAIAIIREEVGPDFPILVKFTPCHFIDEPGYRTMEEGIELAKILEAAGVDALHVDAGCYDNWELCMPPAYQQEQTFALTAAEVIKQVVSIPVVTAGKLGYPERGEKAIEDGKTDLLIIGRAQLADPEYVNKLEKGCFEDIRPCIGCDEGCIGNHTRRISVACAVNPDTGFECFRMVPKAEEPKKMLVIGAGIGGLNFAYDAAMAGHKVEVWEKRAVIGGLLTAAGRPSFKKEVRDLIEYYKIQLVKLGVKVRYSKEATAEEILAYGADEVVLALGDDPIIPRSIPGVDGINVVSVVDALNDTATLGKHLVIVGAGHVGCEAAMHFSDFGKTIDMIEMAPKTMPGDVFIQCRRMIDASIEADSNITVHTGTKLVSVEKDGAIVEHNGEQKKLACDTVVLALGLRQAKSDLYDQLKDKTSVHVIEGGMKVLESTANARVALLKIMGKTEADYTRTCG